MSRPMKWVLAAGAVALLLFGGLLYVGRHRFFHPNVQIDYVRNPVIGIDVSNHNGRIDFEKVRGNGVSFVYMKASEGRTYVDPSFAKNYKKMQGLGLKVGAYHFFRKKVPGKEQAQNFLRAVGDRHMDLPLVVDVEDWGNDKHVADEQTVKELVAMVAQLKRSGRPVMIYTNGDGYKSYVAGHLDDEYLWMCSFHSPKNLRKMYRHKIQQYSHWGTVDGISGEVDLDVFNGSRAEWNKWLSELSEGDKK